MRKLKKIPKLLGNLKYASPNNQSSQKSKIKSRLMNATRPFKSVLFGCAVESSNELKTAANPTNPDRVDENT